MDEPLITKDQINPSAGGPQQGISSVTGILIALLAAIIAGAGVWAYYTYKIIPDLNKQPSTTVYSKPASSTSTADETANWKTYTNSTYGFTLTFNDLWKGYQVIEKTPSDKSALAYLYVCVPTSSKTWTDVKTGVFCPFSITVVSANKWDQFKQVNEPLVPTIIKQNSLYVFAKSSAQDNPEDGFAVMKDQQNILSTFQFIK